MRASVAINSILIVAHLTVVGAGACLAGPDAPSGTIITVAGAGPAGYSRRGNPYGAYSGDGGPAITAKLNFPGGLAVDAVGNLFIADSGNNLVRKVSPAGVITTVAGDTKTDQYGNVPSGFSGDGGPATKAMLDDPGALAVDASGDLFIADSGNNRVRKVSPAGIITTVAGGGMDVPGAGEPATKVALSNPEGVAIDGKGDLYVTEGGMLCEVNPRGIITTLAGGFAAPSTGDGGLAINATFSALGAVSVDRAGNIYVVDGNQVRKIDTRGIINTVAGGGGGRLRDGAQAVGARLYPGGLALDSSGNLYIADQFDNRIRRVDPAGIITSVAGAGNTDFFGDGDKAINAALYGPNGLAIDARGNLFIADSDNERVREVFAITSLPTVKPQPVAQCPIVGDVNGDGRVNFQDVVSLLREVLQLAP